MAYVYVLGMLECSFGEWSIYGIYSEIEKLKDDYMYLLTSEDTQIPYCPSEEKRQAFVLRYPLNEFIGIAPEWNDNKLLVDEKLYEIKVDEIWGKEKFIKNEKEEAELIRP